MSTTATTIAILRAVQARPLAARDIQQIVGLTAMPPREFVSGYITPLSVRGWIDRLDRDSHRWQLMVSGQRQLEMAPAPPPAAIPNDGRASSRPRSSLGNGDSKPPVLRPGSEIAAGLPSRFGDRLVYPRGAQ